MSAFYKIGEFSEKTGFSILTLRRCDKEGNLKLANQDKRVRKTRELMKSLQEDGD